jgi:hypothetical protein
MLHEARFVTGEAGGVIEYRDCPNGVNCDEQPWQDLITPIESANSVMLYDGTIFPTLDAALNRVVSNRPVFQGMAASQTVDEPVPNNLFSSPFVQFRFVYQVVENGGFPPPGTWTVESFNYTYDELVADNVLQLPEPTLIPCPGEILTFIPGVVGSYQFDFYTTIDDIVAGNPPVESNTTGVWTYPIALSNTTYYVVVENTNTNVRRIWPLTALADQDVPEFEICIAAWFSDPFDAGCDLNDDLINDVRDLIIQRNGDLCVD